jgi:hypothetical protein
MKHLIFKYLIAALLSCAASQALANIVDIKWVPKDGASTYENTLKVPASKAVELCGDLKLKDTVAWRFAADAPLDFNVHYHLGKDATFVTLQRGERSADGTFTVAVEEAYCWMWTNRERKDVNVKVMLKR